MEVMKRKRRDTHLHDEVRNEKISHVHELYDQVFSGSSGSSSFFEKFEAGDYDDKSVWGFKTVPCMIHT